jgi:hypothetical protein
MRGESSEAQLNFCPAVQSSRWRRRWGCWQDPQSGYSEFFRPDAQFVLPSRRLGNFRDYEASLVGCWTGAGFAQPGAIGEAVKRDSELRRSDDAALLHARAKRRY